MTRWLISKAPGLLVSTLLFAAWPPVIAGQAGVVYVTDELRLGLYRTEETSGQAIRTLISGTRLEILERALMSIRVRTEDGDEGWVKTAFVVEKEPARRRLARLEALQSETARALEARTSEVEALSARVEDLGASLAVAEQGIEDLPAVRAENEALRAAREAGGIRVPLVWVALLTGASLIFGIAAGYRWLDRRVRRQFGGLKVY